MGMFIRVSAGQARATAMLDRMGRDPQDAFGQDPVIFGRNMRNRALGCTVCQSKEACDKLLAARISFPEAPEFCPNKDSLDRLTPATPDE